MPRLSNGIDSAPSMIAKQSPNAAASRTALIGELAFKACEDCIAAAGCAILTQISGPDDLFHAVFFNSHYLLN